LDSLSLSVGAVLADFVAGLLNVAPKKGVDATNTVPFRRDLSCVCATFQTISDSRNFIVIAGI
jgi:hypothetical protein